MSIKLQILALLLLVSLSAGCSQQPSFGTPTLEPTGESTQVLPSTTPPAVISPEIEQRRQRVENGLVQVTQDGQVSWEEKYSILERMQHYGVPGVSIAVINDNRIEWAQGYGVMETGGDQPVTADSLFHACSMAKPVSSAGVLTLVEDGQLELDEDVNGKLVSWQVPENAYTIQEKVTLRRLLSHTSGLNDGFDEGGLECCYGTEGEAPSVGVVQMLEAGPESGIDEPTYAVQVPGGEYRYNNLAYSIVQPLVEDLTDEPFAYFMQRTVLDPVGMTSSTFQQPLPADLRARAVKEHEETGEPTEGSRRHYAILPSGGLWATPSDLARFTIELMAAYNGEPGAVFSHEIVREMLSPQVAIPDQPLQEAYGLGMDIDHDGDLLRIQHTGGCPWGSNGWLLAYPETGQGAVVMTNSVNGSILRVEILVSLAIEYGWPLVTPSK